jgi:hypothetical protein
MPILRSSFARASAIRVPTYVRARIDGLGCGVRLISVRLMQKNA